MTEENYQLLLVRRITQNKLSSEELSLLKQHKEAFDPEGELEKNLMLAWNSIDDTERENTSARLADKIADRIYLEKSNKPHRIGVFTKIAATIFFIVGISLYLLTNNEDKTEWVTFIAEAGKLSSLTLPDGSKIKAKPGTWISYPKVFTPEKRSIKISGTAFFSVIADPERPFIVSAGPTTTTVLGTSFSISYDSLVQESRIAVLEGKVRVETAIQSTYLKDMEVIAISLNDQTTSIGILKDQHEFDWTKGVFSYQDTPINEILEELSQWYGVTIESKKLENCVFTGRFHTENLQIVLMNIALSNQLKLTKKENKHYVLTGKGC